MMQRSLCKSFESKTGRKGLCGHVSWMIATTLLVLFCGATQSNAQAKYLGALSGAVSDAAGGRVPGANITATDTTTKFVSKVVTDAAGEYTIPFITPDTYDVTVSANGFGPQ